MMQMQILYLAKLVGENFLIDDVLTWLSWSTNRSMIWRLTVSEQRL